LNGRTMSNFGIYPFFAIDQAWPNWLIFVLLLVDLVIRIVALGWIPHNRRPSVALGWLLAIFLIPYVGILVFVLLGSAKLPKRRRDKQSQINDLIRDQLRNRAIIGQRDHMPEPLSTAAQLNFDLGALPMTHGNGFEFYRVAIDAAPRRLLAAPLIAYQRGDRVRILIAHVGSRGYRCYSDLVKRLDASGDSLRRPLPIRPCRGEYQRPELRNRLKVL